jgi:hypothetical protein
VNAVEAVLGRQYRSCKLIDVAHLSIEVLDARPSRESWQVGMATETPGNQRVERNFEPRR